MAARMLKGVATLAVSDMLVPQHAEFFYFFFYSRSVSFVALCSQRLQVQVLQL